jgi:hypothetical protein
MKLSVSFFAFASVWHSVHGQEQLTFLRGRGAEAEAAVEDEGTSFGNMVNSHKYIEEDREDDTTKIGDRWGCASGFTRIQGTYRKPDSPFLCIHGACTHRKFYHKFTHRKPTCPFLGIHNKCNQGTKVLLHPLVYIQQVYFRRLGLANYTGKAEYY